MFDRSSPESPIRQRWARLEDALGGDDRPQLFDPASLDELPAAAARFLRRALPNGTPLVSVTTLAMTGRIKLGRRWFPYRADQVLQAGRGFVWVPTVGRIVRFVGVDMLDESGGRMQFALFGRVPVVDEDGPAITRSAAGRLAVETAAWLPQALTPQSGALWRPVDERRAAVSLPGIVDQPDVEVTVDDDGRLLSVRVERWNASTKPPATRRTPSTRSTLSRSTSNS